jgi:hypothetical protein
MLKKNLLWRAHDEMLLRRITSAEVSICHESQEQSHARTNHYEAHEEAPRQLLRHIIANSGYAVVNQL